MRNNNKHKETTMAKYKVTSECREGGKVLKAGEILDIDPNAPGSQERLGNLFAAGRIVPTQEAPAKPMSTTSGKS